MHDAKLDEMAVCPGCGTTPNVRFNDFLKGWIAECPNYYNHCESELEFYGPFQREIDLINEWNYEFGEEETQD